MTLQRCLRTTLPSRCIPWLVLLAISPLGCARPDCPAGSKPWQGRCIHADASPDAQLADGARTWTDASLHHGPGGCPHTEGPELCNERDDDCDGMTDEDCIGPHVAEAKCQEDSCRITTCASGYGNCDGTTDTGCEANLDTSQTDCGKCGNACTDPHGDASCEDGICTLHSCETGFHACENRCADDTDVGSCGSRCAPCPEPPHGGYAVCTDGTCAVSCEDGFKFDPSTGGTQRCSWNDPSLQALSPSAGTLSPAFDPEITDYTLELPLTAEEVTFAPLASAPDPSFVTLDVDGETVTSGQDSPPRSLPLGRSTFEVTVTTESAASRIYTVEVLRGFRLTTYVKASNTDTEDYFGYSMAISDDTLVVGAPGESSSAETVDGNQDDNFALAAGAAYVFGYDGTQWVQQAYLKADNGEKQDTFGLAVDVDEDTIVVGAPGEDDHPETGSNSLGASGAAYVFLRDGTSWRRNAYFKASNPDTADGFGYDVAIEGDTVVVGAPGEDGNGVGGVANNEMNNAGAAYVFSREPLGWSDPAYVKAPHPDADDNFGVSVAIDGETIVVGARGERSNGTDGPQDNSLDFAGAAYVFTPGTSGWSQEAYLKALDPVAYEAFGASVAIDGDTVVVGADGRRGRPFLPNQPRYPSAIAGSAYVYVRTSSDWMLDAALQSRHTGPEDAFGHAVAVRGHRVVVGAPLEDGTARNDLADDGTANSGAAYVFVRSETSWIEHDYLKASHVDPQDNFGMSVALTRDRVSVAGAREDGSGTGLAGEPDDNGTEQSGAMYVFER